jgi:hypothetical protein
MSEPRFPRGALTAETAYALSKDRRTLTIKRRTPAGILTSTFSRAAQTPPFTDADVENALSGVPAASRTMQPGQRTRARRFVTRSGTLYVHVMTGPPTWWLPRVKRGKDGALMAGWLRGAVAVKVVSDA